MIIDIAIIFYSLHLVLMVINYELCAVFQNEFSLKRMKNVGKNVGIFIAI